MKDKIKKAIEKKYLKIRGWKNWAEYDDIQQATELDKNTREELINISVNQTLKEVVKMFDKKYQKLYTGVLSNKEWEIARRLLEEFKQNLIGKE